MLGSTVPIFTVKRCLICSDHMNCILSPGPPVAESSLTVSLQLFLAPLSSCQLPFPTQPTQHTAWFTRQQPPGLAWFDIVALGCCALQRNAGVHAFAYPVWVTLHGSCERFYMVFPVMFLKPNKDSRKNTI